jgi:fermentation-respiration switch protein FrsA (DUF1100 family)
MRVLFGIITILFLLTIAYFGIGAYIAYKLTIQNPSPVTYDKDKIGRGTDVVFRASDNLQLAGWYFPGINDKAIMFVHGAGNQNRANEVYGTPDIAKYFLEQGYAILLIDLRGTGESQNARISFGEYESLDVAGAFSYLKTQGYKPSSIGIIGDSLGAIATIMAADAVKSAGGIVLDSPAATVRPIVTNIMRNEHSIPVFLDPAIFFWAKALYNIDVDKVKPIDHITTLKNTPLLFLHGQADTLISPFNSAELLSKVNNGQRVLFPNAGHVETFKTNPDLYKKVVSAFFSTHIK